MHWLGWRDAPPRAASVDLTMEANMSIPSRLSSYLEQRGARYEVCAHQPSRTSAQSARTANVPPHELAKSVIRATMNGCEIVLP